MDELLDRWHAFSSQPVDEIAAQYDDAGRALLARVVREGLGDAKPFAFGSAQEFAKYIVELRSNEKDWSRCLGDALLKSQEQLDGGLVAEAKATLGNFRAACPWRFFSEIAEIQLQNIDG